MQELNGYVKIFRKFKRWGWYQNTVVKVVFLHCLLSASFRDFEWMGKKYKSGQFVCSIGNMAKELDLTPKQVRSALEKLCKSKELGKQGTNKFTVITVMKWADYQTYEEPNNCNGANQGQSNDIQKTNQGQQYKNIKNRKNIKKDAYESAWPNVVNLSEEYKKSLIKF